MLKPCVNTRSKKNELLWFYIALAILSGASLVLYFWGYRRTGALYGSEEITILNMIKFVSVAYTNFFKATISYPYFGLIFVIPLLVIGFRNGFSWVYSAWKLPHERKVDHLISAFLIAFSFLFILAAGYGRLPFGLRSAYASRYLTYLIPSIVGVYLFARKNLGIVQLVLLAGVFLVAIGASFERERMYFFSSKKKQWKQQFLELNSVEKTNMQTGFTIHPKSETIWFQERMDFLRENNLNLFRDSD